METLTYTDANGNFNTFKEQTNIIFTYGSFVNTPGYLVKYSGKGWSIIYKNPFNQTPSRLDLTSEKMEDLRFGRFVIIIDYKPRGGRSRRRRNKRRTRRLR